MKRIPRAFVADEATGLLTPQPRFPWFAAGYGIASRKWDGIPAMIAQVNGEQAYTFFRGVSTTMVPTTPGFIQTSDAGDPEIRGWVPLPLTDPQRLTPDDQRFIGSLQVLYNHGRLIEPGTYELVGPEIKDNPERVDRTGLWKHECVCYIHCPRDLIGTISFLADHPGEGVVWRYGDEYCQLTRRDVGLAWPV